MESQFIEQQFICQIYFLQQLYNIMSLASNIGNKCQNFISKLATQTDQAREVWRHARKSYHLGRREMINQFLTGFMGNQDYNFLSKGLNSEKIKQFLNNTIILEEGYDQIQLQKLKRNLMKEQMPFEIINGEDIIIQISYNTSQVDKDYNFRKFTLQKEIQRFVKTELAKSMFDIRTQYKSIKILEGKQEITDKYVETYIFDPFFDCLKIVMRKLNSNSFIGKFRIESSSISQFYHIEDNTIQAQINETYFDLNDPIDKLLTYIFLKENASLEDELLVRQFFNKQRLRLISDLSFDTQYIVRQIPKLKWAKEVQNQFFKIKGSIKNQKRRKRKMHPKKRECIILGNSHKILRYAIYMSQGGNVEGLDILNKRIPLLNPYIVQKALQIIQTELIISNLFPKLCKCFKAFCITDIQKDEKGIPKFDNPNGILFYGPPGNGKTELTQDLAQLMGMNPISSGLSSAKFMKELVGQAGGMMRGYFKRSKISPHLICSISIDQIEAIFNNRGYNRTNGETAASILSLLGGNENIQNLLVFGSTNFRNEIDQAILRRFTPNFYVGIPSLEDRRSIIIGKLPNLGKKEINFLSRMTPNFSGAALKAVCHDIALLICEKKKDQKIQIEELLEILQSVGAMFKIKFGKQTYAHLHCNAVKEISMDIMRKTINNFAVIERQTGKDLFNLIFAKQQKQWNEGLISQYIEIKKFELSLSTINFSFQETASSIEKNIKGSNPEIQIIVCDCLANAQKYHQEHSKPTLMIVNISNKGQLVNNRFFNKPQNNLYVICIVEGIAGQQAFKYSKVNISNGSKLFSGKFLIDLTKKGDSSMLFETVKNQNCSMNIEMRRFMQKGIHSTQDALPQIVEFLIAQQIDFIQVLDSQLMIDNNAFNDQQYQRIISYKIDEADNYKSSAFIIDMGSLVSVRKDTSSQIIGILQTTIYRNLVELIKNFPSTSTNWKKWIILIIDDEQLLKIALKETKWNSFLNFDVRNNDSQFDKVEGMTEKFQSSLLIQ